MALKPKAVFGSGSKIEISVMRLVLGLFYCFQDEKGKSTEISKRGLFTL